MSMTVRGYLQDIVDMFEKAGRTFEGHTPHSFELAYGRDWEVTGPRETVLPNGYIGPLRHCYENAFEAMLANDDLTYCEGTCLMELGVPLLHSFCVDKSGNVYDPTWTNQVECRYHGIAFDRDRVLFFKQLFDPWSSIMDDYKNRFPLYRGHYDIDEWRNLDLYTSPVLAL